MGIDLQVLADALNQHIPILAAILLRVCRLCEAEPDSATLAYFIGRRLSAWVALGGVAIYAVLVGAEASVVRVAIMAAIFIFATCSMGRSSFASAGLITAAIVMTLINFHDLLDQ